ncbi:MAG: dTDP-glucose 4,6-dehydratase [Caldisphaera sp.]
MKKDSADNIVITGGTGFIATNLIEYYLKNTDAQIISITKNTQASYAQKRISDLIAAYPSKFKNYWCDITDYVKLNTILNREKPNQIIHLAAEADVSRSFDYPHDFLNTNLIGTYNLLEWIRNNGLEDTKMLYFSTDEVFSEPDHLSVETERLYPKNPYSASKAAAEQYIYAWNECYGTKIQVARPVNNYGPYQGPNRLFAKTIINAINNIPITLFRETKQHKRWWLYVGDTCNAVDIIINKGDPKGIYHITSDIEFTVEEVVLKILDYMGKKELFKGYREYRPKDDENYALDGSKLKDLGWAPKYTFEEGIEKTIEWYKQNLEWFTKI